MLTSTVNNQGYPTLAEPSTPYHPFDEANQGHNLVLDAYTMIFVHNADIVAGIACEPLLPPTIPKNTEADDDSEPQASDDDSEFQASNDSELSSEGASDEEEGLQELDPCIPVPFNIIFVANPDDKDKYFDKNSLQNCMVVSPGDVINQHLFTLTGT